MRFLTLMLTMLPFVSIHRCCLKRGRALVGGECVKRPLGQIQRRQRKETFMSVSESSRWSVGRVGRLHAHRHLITHQQPALLSPAAAPLRAWLIGWSRHLISQHLIHDGWTQI